MVASGEKAVVRHLHGDRAKPFANAERADVAKHRAADGVPIETIVLVEAAVFSGDEGVLHVLRHRGQRDVHSADDLEPADQPSVAIEDPTAFTRLERADRRGRGTAGEATGAEPDAEKPDAEDGRGERNEDLPLPANPLAGRIVWIAPHAGFEDTKALGQR